MSKLRAALLAGFALAATFAFVGTGNGAASAEPFCEQVPLPPVCAGSENEPGPQPSPAPNPHPVPPSPAPAPPPAPVVPQLVERNAVRDQHPYSAVVSVHPASTTATSTIAGTDNPRCTGFVIGPKTVATAAHCLYKIGAFTSLASGKVLYQWNGAQLQLCNVVKAWVPERFKQLDHADPTAGDYTEEQSRWDFGAVNVDCPLSTYTGTMTLTSTVTPPVGGVTLGAVSVACEYAPSYPGLWAVTAGYTVTSASPGVIDLSAEIEPGCSGGPLMNASLVYGITSTSDSIDEATAHRLTSESINDLMWMVNAANPPSGGGGGTQCVPGPRNNCDSGPIIAPDPTE